MKVHYGPLKIRLAVLIWGCLSYTNAIAQPMSGFLVSAKTDTLTKYQEEILIDLLDSSLQSLAHKDRQGRMIGGYVLLGLGAGSAVGGAVTLAVGEGDDARIVGYSLLGGGALLGGLSLIPFKIKTEAEYLYADFTRDIEGMDGRDRQKYNYWNHRFEELAGKSKRGRIIGGITSIVAGAVTSIVFVEGTGKEQLHAFLWPAIGGITTLLVKSDAERRYETYMRAREEIIGKSAVSEIYFGIVPFRKGGIMGTVQLRF